MDDPVKDPAPLEPGGVLGGLVDHEDGDGRPRRWEGSGIRKGMRKVREMGQGELSDLPSLLLTFLGLVAE